MENRKIGSQGLVASQLGLGCMGMSEFYGAHDDDESIRTIHRALELGINFLDTADAYGPFTNEELVGSAIKGKRNKVVLATKFGFVRNSSDPNWRGLNGKPEYIKKACEDSLKRLQVDTIDLYYQHRLDPQTAIEDSVEAMAGLVKEGKIRGIGLSEVSTSTLRKAHRIHPISALQTEYSLWTRDPEDDWRRNAPRFQGENIQKNLELVKKIEAIAASKSCTNAQLALAWVMAQGDFIFPIPGTKRIKYLEENTEALKVKLSAEDFETLNTIAPKGIAAGTRYTEGGMKIVNQ